MSGSPYSISINQWTNTSVYSQWSCYYSYVDDIGLSELDESVTALVSQCGCLSNSDSASPWLIWPVNSWIMCCCSDRPHQKHYFHAIQPQTLRHLFVINDMVIMRDKVDVLLCLFYKTKLEYNVSLMARTDVKDSGHWWDGHLPCWGQVME